MDISEIEEHSIDLLEQVKDDIVDIEWYIENRKDHPGVRFYVDKYSQNVLTKLIPILAKLQTLKQVNL
jgi:hypothetical protein